jgi:hypothetical protein
MQISQMPKTYYLWVKSLLDSLSLTQKKAQRITLSVIVWATKSQNTIFYLKKQIATKLR